MELFESPSAKKNGIIDTYFSKLHALRASDAFFLRAALLACVIFLAFFLVRMSMQATVQIPAFGGVFSEGIIGTPRFVNPVLSVTRADKDLAALIYDGIMHLNAEGTLVPSVAESVTISEDGLTYNVLLKQNVRFHDGTPLTARDIAFTVLRIQDPTLNSPLLASFDGILVEEVGEYELNFVLPEAYGPFIENLTFGILPEHIWKDAGVDEFPFSQYNSEPIGSGPYKIKNIERNTSGIPVTYILTANTDYHSAVPKIETMEFHFYSTEEKLLEAFKEGVIESVVGIDPEHIGTFALDPETYHLERIPLPRTFALFINQNKSPALRDLAARNALNSAVDRKMLIENVLGGYGNALYSPVPPGFTTLPATQGPEASIDGARDILRNGGWKINAETQHWEKKIDDVVVPLQFSIATANNSTFEATAEFLRNTWTQIGAEVTVKQFEQSDLNQAVIRPRDYETLLFGTQLGRSLDYYSFWHSSQRNDPGLNVALYANITTDSILSEIRRNNDHTIQTEAIQKFTEELNAEIPAVFLYAPELLYIVPNRVTGATFTGVSEPQERFSTVYDWYIQTESIWPFFKK
jgi:peptide/nickel transport system substrate-binding protein